jgi:hypothetical protein
MQAVADSLERPLLLVDKGLVCAICKDKWGHEHAKHACPPVCFRSLAAFNQMHFLAHG